MVSIKNYSKRSIAVVAAFGLVTAALVPLLSGIANAGVVTERNIKISDSKPAATGVVYQVNFKVATTATVKGIVVDFCSDTPIVGETCTAPTGFAITTATPTNQVGISGFANATSTTSTLKITNATGTALTAADQVSFTVTSTNPTPNATFYARILTYANDTGSNSPATYTATSPGTYIDYGGDALTTTNAYTITSAVQEYIAFGVDFTALTLGETASGVMILDTPYITNQTYTTTTNASAGETVRLWSPSGSPGFGSLSNGTQSFTTVTSRVALDSGTNQFGLCIQTPTPGTGTLTPDAQYSNGGTACDTTSSFALDTTAVSATYGDPILSSTGPVVATGTNNLTYGAKVGATQPAGIYTTTHELIATGTF